MIVAAGSPPEQHIHPYLVEDRLPSIPGYVEWMTNIHKIVVAKA